MCRRRHDDVAPARDREAREIRAAVATPWFVHDVRARGGSQRGRAVGRAVVDHHHLPLEPGGEQGVGRLAREADSASSRQGS